jgi:hypothetical protein
MYVIYEYLVGECIKIIHMKDNMTMREEEEQDGKVV